MLFYPTDSKRMQEHKILKIVHYRSIAELEELRYETPIKKMI